MHLLFLPLLLFPLFSFEQQASKVPRVQSTLQVSPAEHLVLARPLRTLLVVFFGCQEVVSSMSRHNLSFGSKKSLPLKIGIQRKFVFFCLSTNRNLH